MGKTRFRVLKYFGKRYRVAMCWEQFKGSNDLVSIVSRKCFCERCVWYLSLEEGAAPSCTYLQQEEGGEGCWMGYDVVT